MSDSVKKALFYGRRRALIHLAGLAASLLPMPLVSQEAAPKDAPVGLEIPTDLGFIRLVNAVGMSGRLKVTVDGIEADPAGFKAGFATNGIGLSPKNYQVELEHESLGKGSVQVPLQTGQITTVIAYMTEKPEKGEKAKATAKKEAEKKGPRLAWYVDQSPASPPDVKESVLSLMQFTPSESLDFKVVDTPVSTGAEKPTRVPITNAMGSFPDVFYQGKIVSGLNFQFRADQFVVFYAGEDGNLKCITMRNDVQ